MCGAGSVRAVSTKISEEVDGDEKNAKTVQKLVDKYAKPSWALPSEC